MLKSSAGNFVLEALLWTLASITCVLLPTATVYLVGSTVLDWGPGYLSFYTTCAILASLTWGSWASLIWTRNPLLRGMMEIGSLLPGVLVLAVGFFGLYVGFGTWWIWLGLIAASIGMLVGSFGLNRTLGRQRTSDRRMGIVFGLLVFPPATTALGLGVSSLWYHFITNPVGGDWRSLFSIATLMVTVLAIALVTTVVPAVMSSGCRKASSKLDEHRGS